MDGFTSLFTTSENCFNNITIDNYEEIFKSFRVQKTMFGYIDNGDIPPDEEAIRITKSINQEMYFYYINQLKNRKIIGYEGSTFKYGYFTHVDSRHIMMSTIIFNTIKDKLNNILEIGGGFGNWLYLNRNQNFDKWTIIDLPHIGKLQSWCLNQLDVDSLKYDIVYTDDYKNIISNKYDIVIGAHSLSEFSIEMFNNYFNNTIIKSKYFFYAYHKYSPNEILCSMKRDIINKYFNILVEIPSESNNILNCLFINKNHDYSNITVVKNNISFIIPPDNIFIQNWYKNHYEKWEEDSFNIINKFVSKDKILFDVGSWVGLISIPYSYKFAKVIAIEADKESVSCFRNIIEVNSIKNIEIIEKAVYSKSNETLIFGPNMFRPDGLNESTSQLKHISNNSSDYSVNTIRLLDVIKPYLLDIAIIKIDIEGGEINLLDDIILLLEFNIPIFISFHFLWISDKQKIIDFSNLVSKKNYKIFDNNYNIIEGSIYDNLLTNNFASFLIL